MKYKAGFIGAGNMGGTLLRAVAGAVGGMNTAVYDINTNQAKTAAEKAGAAILPKEELILQCEYITDGSTVVSMAAGIDLSFLCRELKTDRVIRIMPNTPADVGEGTVLYCTADGVKDENKFLSLMEKCGLIDKIDESLIDAAAALSGCGPAFVYMFIEALADGAVRCGLPRAKAELYAKQTVLGAAKLALSSQKHPGSLKDEVCSPGGTTIEGVLALEKSAFRSAAASAVTAAYDKTAKLKK